MKGFFINPEIKGITWKFLIFQMLLFILVYFIMLSQLNVLKNSIINQNTAVIGKILYKNPELENTIMEQFSREATMEEIDMGKKVTNKYQYTKSLPIAVVPYAAKTAKDIKMIMLIIFFMSSIGVLFLIYIEYEKIFRRVNQISRTAEEAVEGNIEEIQETGEGDFARLSHNFNSMTKRLKLTIEAQGEEKLFLKDILSDISHQLKTPLASLMILNDIMLKRKNTPEKLEEFLEKSKEQLERMEWLIISLLKMAKMEFGSIVFDIREGYIDETIGKSLSILKPLAQEGDKEIIIHEHDVRIKLLHDEKWLSEAFTNIIKNCIEHTERGGKIEIQTNETPLMISISIKDNGEGISPKDLPYIFERFYKARGSKSSSIGIGLSLAKAIIERHGGEIVVKSKLKEGTEFIITFLKNII